jgi:hypothetical protein
LLATAFVGTALVGAAFFAAVVLVTACFTSAFPVAVCFVVLAATVRWAAFLAGGRLPAAGFATVERELVFLVTVEVALERPPRRSASVAERCVAR